MSFVMALYFAFKNEAKTVELYLNMIKELDCKHPAIEQIEDVLKLSFLKQLLNEFSSVQRNKKCKLNVSYRK